MESYNKNSIYFLIIIIIGIISTFDSLVDDMVALYFLALVLSLIGYLITTCIKPKSDNSGLIDKTGLFLAYPLATLFEAPLTTLIIQLVAVMILIAIPIYKFKNVSDSCTETHCKKVRDEYLTEMSVINLGVIATINYLKGPLWASFLSNVVTIIYYFYISDGPKLVSARFRRTPRNLQDNEEQEELFGINADI